MDGRTDGLMDSLRLLQDFVPFGAAALLCLNGYHQLLEQGTGTANHLPFTAYRLPLKVLKA